MTCNITCHNNYINACNLTVRMPLMILVMNSQLKDRKQEAGRDSPELALLSRQNVHILVFPENMNLKTIFFIFYFFEHQFLD